MTELCLAALWSTVPQKKRNELIYRHSVQTEDQLLFQSFINQFASEAIMFVEN